jgi:hypothetical protein
VSDRIWGEWLEIENLNSTLICPIGVVYNKETAQRSEMPKHEPLMSEIEAHRIVRLYGNSKKDDITSEQFALLVEAMGVLRMGIEFAGYAEDDGEKMWRSIQKPTQN